MSIDYGMGKTNIDPETGIRYGCVSVHSLNPDVIYDAQELDYGKPHCPKCGNAAATIPAHTEQRGAGVSVIQDVPEAYEDYEMARGAYADYACESCRYLFDGGEAFPDEPLGWYIDDGEYKVVDCLDSDALVIKSPYYTLANFCSPCVPGAGNLDSHNTDGVKTYCFGHDWFDDGKAPYPVYAVATGERVEPNKGE
jgi:hypothetical protein